MPRSANVSAQITQDGNKIRMTFEGYDFAKIAFNKETGASGSEAFDKLRRILDVEQTNKKQDAKDA